MGPEGSSDGIKDAAIDFCAGSLGIPKILTYCTYLIEMKCETHILMRVIKWWRLMKHI
jgi:hypothetical protein